MENLSDLSREQLEQYCVSLAQKRAKERAFMEEQFATLKAQYDVQRKRAHRHRKAAVLHEQNASTPDSNSETNEAHIVPECSDPGTLGGSGCSEREADLARALAETQEQLHNAVSRCTELEAECVTLRLVGSNSMGNDDPPPPQDSLVAELEAEVASLKAKFEDAVQSKIVLVDYNRTLRNKNAALEAQLQALQEQ